MKTALPSILLPGCLAACGTDHGPSDRPPTGQLGVTVSPLQSGEVASADYTITVHEGTCADKCAEIFTEDVSSNSSRASLRHVGTCSDPDGAGSPNCLTVSMNRAYDGSGAEHTDVMLPPPSDTDFTCTEGQDVRVDVTIDLLVSGGFGFTAIAIAINEIACSAKVECVEEFLVDPQAGQEGWTLMTGMACYADGMDHDQVFVGFEGKLCCPDGAGGQTCADVGVDPGTGG